MQKFEFDLQGFKQKQGLKQFYEICQTPFDHSSLHNLVKSYLVHYGHVETLQAYQDEEMQNQESTEPVDESEKKDLNLGDQSNKFPGLTQT